MTKDKLNNFVTELSELLKKYNVDLGADIDGDTHGISENFVVDDNETKEAHIIAHYQSYITARDLDDYLK